MHHGVPESRDRIYVVFTRQGPAIDLEMETERLLLPLRQPPGRRSGVEERRTVGRYRQQ